MYTRCCFFARWSFTVIVFAVFSRQCLVPYQNGWRNYDQSRGCGGVGCGVGVGVWGGDGVGCVLGWGLGEGVCWGVCWHGGGVGVVSFHIARGYVRAGWRIVRTVSAGLSALWQKISPEQALITIIASSRNRRNYRLIPPVIKGGGTREPLS